MSWDIFIQDIPASARTVRDIPDDFEPRPLGPRSELADRIAQVAPTTTFQSPEWGVFEGPGFAVEFNLGGDDIAWCLALHVRGDGAAAVGLVADLLTRFGWRALDAQSESGLFDAAVATDSFEKWRRYRDEVLRGPTSRCSRRNAMVVCAAPLRGPARLSRVSRLSCSVGPAKER